MDLSVSASSWCLERAAVCDCGTPWTFTYLVFTISVIVCHCMYVLEKFVF